MLGKGGILSCLQFTNSLLDATKSYTLDLYEQMQACLILKCELHYYMSYPFTGNLTKHMKSKAHMKKCLELGVSVSMDETEILEHGKIVTCNIFEHA